MNFGVEFEKLQKYAATRDAKVIAAYGWGREPPITARLQKLLNGETVVVGGRATCGGKVDPTWTELVLWRQVICKARAIGVNVVEAPIKQGNAWATKCGGFWDEYEYRVST